MIFWIGHEDYYYFYNYCEENCDKVESVEDIIIKPNHENLEQAIGVILVLITTFIAFFHKDEDAHEDDDENQVNRINEDFEYDLKYKYCVLSRRGFNINCFTGLSRPIHL